MCNVILFLGQGMDRLDRLRPEIDHEPGKGRVSYKMLFGYIWPKQC